MLHFGFALALLCASPQDKVQDEIEKLKKDLQLLRENLERATERLSAVESEQSLLQPFHLQVYSNITAKFDDREAVKNVTALGQLDLFIMADLGKGLSVLTETALVSSFSGTPPVNAQADTLQRVYVKYKFEDWLSVKFGREHTPIGYWNYEFHHAGYLQTPVDRPAMWTFESSGGLLPTHYVGPEISGTVDVLGGISYMAYAGNGRGRFSTEVTNSADYNDEKAAGGRLEYVGIDGLRIGGSVFYDTVTLVNPLPTGKTKFKEMILGAHAIWTIGDLTLVAEGFALTHDDLDLAEERSFQGGYGMISYEIGEWNLTPYALGERMNFDSSDPFLGTRKDFNQVRVGLRWDFHPNAAVKFEFDRTFLREEDEVDILMIDVSFGI